MKKIYGCNRGTMILVNSNSLEVYDDGTVQYYMFRKKMFNQEKIEKKLNHEVIEKIKQLIDNSKVMNSDEDKLDEEFISLEQAGGFIIFDGYGYDFEFYEKDFGMSNIERYLDFIDIAPMHKRILEVHKAIVDLLIENGVECEDMYISKIEEEDDEWDKK